MSWLPAGCGFCNVKFTTLRDATMSQVAFAEQAPEPVAAAGHFEALREFWQTTAPFDPTRKLDSLEDRYAQG